MQPDQYLGWLALGWTLSPGPFMAGKLLQDLGIPEAIFNAPLTSLEAFAQVQVLGCHHVTWTNRTTRGASVKSKTLLRCSMAAETLNFKPPLNSGCRLASSDPSWESNGSEAGKGLGQWRPGYRERLGRGIDSSAHKGALSFDPDASIEVLGCGIDVLYPKENKKIFEEMMKRGASITEFPMGGC